MKNLMILSSAKLKKIVGIRIDLGLLPIEILKGNVNSGEDIFFSDLLYVQYY